MPPPTHGWSRDLHSCHCRSRPEDCQVALSAAPAVDAAADKPSPEARLAEAAELFSTGRYAECEQHFAAVGRSDVRLGLAARAFYGAACCAAQRGDPDGAFGQFANALAVGFRDLERALADPRLEPLRTDPRWLQFLKRTETQQQKHLQTLDKELLAHYVEDREQRLKVTAGADAASFAAASAMRRAKVVKLVEQGRAQQADDCFHAAAVLAGNARRRRSSSAPRSWRAGRSRSTPISSPRARWSRSSERFLTRSALSLRKPVRRLGDSAQALLRRYNFPGNVRQLSNLMERAVLFCSGDTLESMHFPSDVHGNLSRPFAEAAHSSSTSSGILAPSQIHLSFTLGESLANLENRIINEVLKRADANKSLAAKHLGITRWMLDRRRKSKP